MTNLILILDMVRYNRTVLNGNIVKKGGTAFGGGHRTRR